MHNDIKLERNSKIKWELLKLKVKYFSIDYCKEKSRKMNQKIILQCVKKLYYNVIENEFEKIENQHNHNHKHDMQKPTRQIV